eukprot:g39796.t1
MNAALAYGIATEYGCIWDMKWCPSDSSDGKTWYASSCIFQWKGCRLQFAAPRVSKYRKDVVKLEKVEKRFTRMLPGLSNRERLDKLGLFSLERQRLRDDLIEVYKIMRGMHR